MNFIYFKVRWNLVAFGSILTTEWQQLESGGIRVHKQTNNIDLLKKDGRTKNCIYKD